MHLLYKFAKRNTKDLFSNRIGRASHIHDYNVKFLFDRYGEMRHYYPARTEFAVIEADIIELIR